MSGQNAFEFLLEIEQRSRDHAPGLPVEEDNREEWLGIAFRLRQYTLLASMDEVAEVVTPPVLARIPGTRPWVLGLANMRGRLLPILDLQGYLFGVAGPADIRSQRVIVVERGALYAGLMVDAVFGLKHFWEDEQTRHLPQTPTELKPFVPFSYENSDGHFGVLDLASLVDSEEFINIST